MVKLKSKVQRALATGIQTQDLRRSDLVGYYAIPRCLLRSYGKKWSLELIYQLLEKPQFRASWLRASNYVFCCVIKRERYENLYNNHTIGIGDTVATSRENNY